jgi:hypothetical protein
MRAKSSSLYIVVALFLGVLQFVCVFRRKRSPFPDDADRTFWSMVDTRERDDAGNEIIPLTVVFVQRGMNSSHGFSLKF